MGRSRSRSRYASREPPATDSHDAESAKSAKAARKRERQEKREKNALLRSVEDQAKFQAERIKRKAAERIKRKEAEPREAERKGESAACAQPLATPGCYTGNRVPVSSSAGNEAADKAVSPSAPAHDDAQTEADLQTPPPVAAEQHTRTAQPQEPPVLGNPEYERQEGCEDDHRSEDEQHESAARASEVLARLFAPREETVVTTAALASRALGEEPQESLPTRGVSAPATPRREGFFAVDLMEDNFPDLHIARVQYAQQKAVRERHHERRDEPITDGSNYEFLSPTSSRERLNFPWAMNQRQPLPSDGSAEEAPRSELTIRLPAQDAIGHDAAQGAAPHDAAQLENVEIMESQADDEEATQADDEEATQADDEEATQADDEEATQADGEEATQADGEEATQADGEETKRADDEDVKQADDEEVTQHELHAQPYGGAHPETPLQGEGGIHSRPFLVPHRDSGSDEEEDEDEGADDVTAHVTANEEPPACANSDVSSIPGDEPSDVAEEEAEGQREGVLTLAPEELEAASREICPGRSLMVRRTSDCSTAPKPAIVDFIIAAELAKDQAHMLASNLLASSRIQEKETAVAVKTRGALEAALRAMTVRTKDAMAKKIAAETEKKHFAAVEMSMEEDHRQAYLEEDEKDRVTALACVQSREEYERCLGEEAEAWVRVQASILECEAAQETGRGCSDSLLAAFEKRDKLAQELEDIKAARRQAREKERATDQEIFKELVMERSRARMPIHLEAKDKHKDSLDALLASERSKHNELTVQDDVFRAAAVALSSSRTVQDAFAVLAESKATHAEKKQRSKAALEDFLSASREASDRAEASASRKRRACRDLSASKRQRMEADEKFLTAALALEGADPDQMEIALAAAEGATDAAQSIEAAQIVLRREVLYTYGARCEDDADEVIAHQAAVFDVKRAAAYQEN